MIIELTNAKVTIKDVLTWGDSEKIQAALMKGADMSGNAKDAENMNFNFNTDAMLEAKYVALECTVVKIVEGEKEVEFSRDWMNNLSIEDGNKLYDAVDKLGKK